MNERVKARLVQECHQIRAPIIQRVLGALNNVANPTREDAPVSYKRSIAGEICWIVKLDCKLLDEILTVANRIVFLRAAIVISYSLVYYISLFFLILPDSDISI